MGNGLSLHVGLNEVNYERYADGRYPRLFGCDDAAKEMARIAQKRGFVNPTVMTNPPSVTLAAVTQWLTSAAKAATPGDIVLFTFAGHGDQVRDADYDEAKDQALVLYDSLLVDDEIYEILEHFGADVRVVVVADCCYGGSLLTYIGRTLASGAPASLPRPRDSGFAFLRPKVRADVLLLSACDDKSRVKGARTGGSLPPFTSSLVGNWHGCGGTFRGGYVGLKGAIGGQTELFDWLLRNPNVAQQQPFQI